MALIGSIENFNPKISDIVSYIERIEQLFQCNEVEERKKVALFLTLMGGEAYNILKDLLAPALPSSKNFEQLKDTLLSHYAPKRLIIAERYKFYSAQQETSEDVKTFAAKLKNLAKYCEFAGFLKDALRDKFVCGLRAEAIKRKLLTEVDLTFDKAFQIAYGMELAEGQMKAMCFEQVNINKVGKFKSENTRYKPVQSCESSDYKSSTQTKIFKPCYRCGRKHNPEQCPAKQWECFKCHKKGHTSKVCKKKSVNMLQESEEKSEESEVEDDLELGFISNLSENEKSYKVSLKVEGKPFKFEIDSGACKSVMHILDYKKYLSFVEPHTVDYKLKVVTGGNVKIFGEILVDVKYKNQCFKVPLVIIESSHKFAPLLGRNWLSLLNPEWKKIISQGIINNVSLNNKSKPVSTSNTVSQTRVKHSCQSILKNQLVSQVKEKFKNVFSAVDNSCIKHFKVELNLKEGAQPVFHRAYVMPYAMRDRVEKEILKMVDSKVLTKVEHSSWASPIVIVPKKNGEIRICVDFKKTLNRMLDSVNCVLPLPEDIFASLGNKKYFTVIDLKGAYQQLQVGEKSRELLTINTHIGLFRYNRLTYGISSAPGIFQSTMDTILSGLKGVKCYLDDILISGETLKECHEILISVFSRLEYYNVKVNESKCKFFYESVEFLGYNIDSEGIHPTQEKIECILKAPTPDNTTKLKSYLGLLNYYGKFIPMLSTKLKPLYDLCKSGVNVKDEWSSACEDSFQLSKQLLTSDQVLVHYNPKLPIYLTCDASGYGVGAVLSHNIDNVDKPIIFASSTLSTAERNYSNLEREALAIIFGVKKFHKYIFGRKFILITDHQPLQYIFGNNKSIPTTAAARITRWAILLSGYDYEIHYKKGSTIGNADGLSRLPSPGGTKVFNSIFSFSLVDNVPLNNKDIAKASCKDIIIAKVMDMTISGWPNTINDENIKPYFKRRYELSVEQNCL